MLGALAVTIAVAALVSARTLYLGSRRRPHRGAGAIGVGVLASLPKFLLASLLATVCGVWLGWFPSSGREGPPSMVLERKADRGTESQPSPGAGPRAGSRSAFRERNRHAGPPRPGLRHRPPRGMCLVHAEFDCDGADEVKVRATSLLDVQQRRRTWPPSCAASASS
ncbi:hypothetical protein [Streptomyces sp. NPDC047042]|uniref:hypothetical protein n=1 Tax=Streptomyces sp. NPDC047042 TaxID=3154807 RepID=UPI00340077A3